ncbi:MAG: alginate lyase family protein [Armatimonadota bacterium]
MIYIPEKRQIGMLIAIIVMLCAMSAVCFAGNNGKDSGKSKQVVPFLHSEKSTAEVRKLIKSGDAKLTADTDILRRMADGLMDAGPWSVVDKKVVPLSGDKHDYVSQAPYWWPNPNTPDGKPYILKDGEVNPERNNLDSVPLGMMCNTVNVLASAYRVTQHEPYAERAVLLLRTWFIDEKTRMNPHLKYAQGVPGIWDGTSWGIIDTHMIAVLFDSICMLHPSKAWTKADSDGLRKWADEYLQWLLTNRNGKAERGMKNNHGTWYDAQVSALALYCGQESTARQILQDSTRRIVKQIDPDGSQPQEMVRTRPIHYSGYNLHAWFLLALMGDRFNIDIWNYRTEDGRSIRKALDWMIPYIKGEKTIKALDAVPFNPDETAFLLRVAAIKYADRQYEDVLHNLKPAPGAETMSQLDLLYPPSIID